MNLRLLAVPLLLPLAVPALALERTEVRADRDPEAPWDAGASCVVTYANICTGWLWVWNDFPPLSHVGVVFEPCCGDGRLVTTQAYFWTGAPGGWGFTGVLSVNDGSSGCPGTQFGSHPMLPVAGAVFDTWAGVPAGPIVLTYEFGPVDPDEWPEPPIRVSIPTDHPAAGPTGPQACGSCFPSTRPIHTFYYGTSDSPLCPGSPLNDGVCDAEMLFWSAHFSCVVAAKPTTWGSLKNLYH